MWVGRWILWREVGTGGGIGAETFVGLKANHELTIILSD